MTTPLSSLDKLRLLRRTISNWPMVVPDKLGLMYRCDYRTRTGERFLCRPRSTDINEIVVTMSGHEYPPEYSRVPPGGVIFDVGAYIGDSAVYFDRLNRDGGYRGFAFEPAPRNLALLRTNLRLNGVRGFEVVPAAVGDVDGEIRIDTTVDADAVAISRVPGRGTTVDSCRLSTFATGRGIDRVDLLKMDIEGAEYAVLDADYDFVAAAVVRLILEYHTLPGGPGPEWIRDRTAADFRMRHIHEGRGNGVLALDNIHLSAGG